MELYLDIVMFSFFYLFVSFVICCFIKRLSLEEVFGNIFFVKLYIRLIFCKFLFMFVVIF